MTHDIDELLSLIKKLEERIIELEKGVPILFNCQQLSDDGYYWEHG